MQWMARVPPGKELNLWEELHATQAAARVADGSD